MTPRTSVHREQMNERNVVNVSDETRGDMKKKKEEKRNRKNNASELDVRELIDRSRRRCAIS